MNQYPPTWEKIEALADFESANLPLPDNLQKFKLEVFERLKNGYTPNQAFGVCGNQTEKKIRRNFKLREYADLLPGSIDNKSSIIANEVYLIRQRRRDVSAVLKSIDKICRIPSSIRQIVRILSDI